MNVFLLSLFLLFNGQHVDGKRELSASLSKVFGPGLQTNIVLPVRYFYIQAVDSKGKNYTKSPGKTPFNVEITSDNDHVRVWREILNRKDGTFLVRMRFFKTYKRVTITVKHKNENVGKSPFTLKGPIYHEGCNCPQYDSDKWAQQMNCPVTHPQILHDLDPFPVIDLEKMKKDGIEEFGTHNAVCHYSIIDNEVYKKCYGQHVGFAQFMEAWLFSLIRKVKLPDMEFFSNLGDWPLSKRRKPAIPVMSWCGSDETYDIVMPTYDLTESTLETLGRVSLDMMSIQGKLSGPPWKQKINKGFFRGRDSRQERLDLTVLGRAKTDLFDVGLTNFFFFEYDEKKYGPKNQHVSFFDFFKYKYQINIDGTVAAYRFPYLLAGDSVVFKQDSHYYEHFYHDLKPMVHYIPFKRDLSDIEEKLKWAKVNDAEVMKIGLAGQAYARNNLMSDDLYCYSYILFKEYASRQKQKPRIHPEQEHVAMPVDNDSACDCKRKKPKKQKEKDDEQKTGNKPKDHDEL